MKLDTAYLVLAALYLVAGVALGIGMGIAHDFRYAPVHAHINLVGWTTHGLMGLALARWPALQTSRLAKTQFAFYALFSPIFIVGLPISIAYNQPIVAIVGSLGVFIGVLLFAAMAVQLFLRGAQPVARPEVSVG
jgi:hypothetical protein